MTDSSRTQTKGLDRAKLDAVIEPIARAHGGEIVDVEWKSEQGGWVLRLFVEKLGSSEERLTTEQAAVNLELCSNIARELSPALDVADVVPNAYHLEVSSPGVERPLRGERDFLRFAGQKAKLKLHDGLSGQKVLIGILGPLEDGNVTISEGQKTYKVPMSDVASARLVFEFGPAPRPGKPGNKTGVRGEPGKPGKTKTRSA